MDTSECSVMWNQNDMFKNETSASFSSGGRCADASAVGQVCSLRIHHVHVPVFSHTLVSHSCTDTEICQHVPVQAMPGSCQNTTTTDVRLQVKLSSQNRFNQASRSPQPLWDVSPDVSNSTERPCLQPQPQVPTIQASESVGRGSLQNSFSCRNVDSFTPSASSIRLGTEAGDDSPLLAHASRSSAALSLAQASPLSSHPLPTSSTPHTRCRTYITTICVSQALCFS